MASFAYEAINRNGRAVKGSVEADTLEHARTEVKKLGLTPVDVKAQNVLNKDLNIEIGGKPSSRDLSIFCRQFVSMLRAGVTIMDALKMLSDATENKKLQRAITEIKNSTEKGEPLSTAFGEHPDVFPPLMKNMVAAGEASGSLDVAIERMALQYEKTSKTQSAVKKASVYPIVVVVVAIVVVIIMLVKVIPTFSSMFEEMGTELPAITKMVRDLSNGLIANWLPITLVVVAVAVLTISFARTEKGKYFFGGLLLKIPVTNNVVTKSACAQMARTLSTLMASGIPLVECVDIVSKVMGNLYFRDAMEDARDEIMIGQPLSRPLEASGLFPPMVYYMVRIGEETGNTEEMLNKLAEYYEEEVETAIASLMTLMEPMIIIVLAGIVMVILGACLMPMMTMYDTLSAEI